MMAYLSALSRGVYPQSITYKLVLDAVSTIAIMHTSPEGLLSAV